MPIISPLPPRQDAQSSTLQVRLTMAPTYMGSNCGWLFLGLMLIQTYTYYANAKRDSRLFKAFVYSLVIVEIFESGLETYVGYYYLVGGWGQNNTLNVLPKPLLFQPLCNALVAFGVQNYFIWRIDIFASGFPVKLICMLLRVLTVASLGCALAIPIIFLHIDFLPLLFAEARTVTTIWLVTSFVIDITITVSMLIMLHNVKSRAYFSETRDKISQIMRLTIQTGILTSILALVILLFFTQIHVGNMHTWPAYILGKSYAMSLLANLNARADQDAVRHPTDRATRISFNPQNSKSSSNGRSAGSVSFVRPFASNNEGRPESFLHKPIPLSVQESTLPETNLSGFTLRENAEDQEVVHPGSYDANSDLVKPSDVLV